VDEKSAAKVLAALRQTTNRSLLTRLLARIKVRLPLINFWLFTYLLQVTEDQNVLREIMRLRGFSTMNAILRDQQTDEDMCCLVLSFDPLQECGVTMVADLDVAIHMAIIDAKQSGGLEDRRTYQGVAKIRQTTFGGTCDQGLQSFPWITMTFLSTLFQLLEQWAELEIAYRIPKRVPPPPVRFLYKNVC